ncbi:hypothetical protein N7457_003075, partial [Penicillium paradoxum]|uniref:uncharacterized protein n=1 Tax=Penicillium paradoxum TaxID=176176 RepID=UPI002547C144
RISFLKLSSLSLSSLNLISRKLRENSRTARKKESRFFNNNLIDYIDYFNTVGASINRLTTSYNASLNVILSTIYNNGARYTRYNTSQRYT